VLEQLIETEGFLKPVTSKNRGHSVDLVNTTKGAYPRIETNLSRAKRSLVYFLAKISLPPNPL
jgi:hypothetical protein